VVLLQHLTIYAVTTDERRVWPSSQYNRAIGVFVDDIFAMTNVVELFL
jgi:hypothetical protein